MHDPPGSSPFRQSAAPSLGPVAVLRFPAARRVSGALSSGAVGAFSAVVAAVVVKVILAPLAGKPAAWAVGWAFAAGVVGYFAVSYARHVAAEVTLYADRVARRILGRVEVFPLEGLRSVQVVAQPDDMESVDLGFADGRHLALHTWPRGQLDALHALVPPLVNAALERVRRGEEVAFDERPARAIASSVCRAIGLLAVAAAMVAVPSNHPNLATVVVVALVLGAGAIATLSEAWRDGRTGVAVSREGVRPRRSGARRIAWADVESITRDPAGVRVNVYGTQIVAATARSPHRAVMAEVLPALLRESRGEGAGG